MSKEWAATVTFMNYQNPPDPNKILWLHENRKLLTEKKLKRISLLVKDEAQKYKKGVCKKHGNLIIPTEN